MRNGSNLAPASNALSKEPIPKSVARVLNASQTQQEWRSKKRKLETEGFSKVDGDGTRSQKRPKATQHEEEGAGKMKIQPGESLGHFNRRVEDSLRGTVKVALHASAAHARKAKKETEELKQPTKSKLQKSSEVNDSDPDSVPQASRTRPTEYTSSSTSAPRRLNDIVQAPPELKKLPRGAKTKDNAAVKMDAGKSHSLRDGVLSMAQKAMLEEERERAVRLYREMKKRDTGS
ncbi:hypothetical protein EIP91_002159 [Steccherinum ochraceum]|uniref:Uncharacterized protein n=1 Tax=Steccherinum ochraceum TaxID=92696 RepID=A0A4R0RGG8_9APHY|nr:hypothetical protein EIP91_002159 [Steccherinum ochraceum]